LLSNELHAIQLELLFASSPPSLALFLMALADRLTD